MPRNRSKGQRKNQLPLPEVNIISLMDILTTMLFFLLVFATMVNFSVIKGMALVKGESKQKSDEPTFTLEVTLLNKHQARVYLGPAKGLEIVNKKELVSALNGRFKGNLGRGYKRKIGAKTPEQLRKAVQNLLIPIKKGFPHKTRVVLSVADNIRYQDVIDGMAAVRSLKGRKKTFRIENRLGKTKKSKVLFPEVVVAEYKGEK